MACQLPPRRGAARALSEPRHPLAASTSPWLGNFPIQLLVHYTDAFSLLEDLATLARKEKGDDEPAVDAANIVPLSLILVGTLAGVYIVALLSGFRLTKGVGLIFFSFYFIFVAYDLLHEFDMIPF